MDEIETRILITGGHGFLGSNLIHQLEHDGATHLAITHDVLEDYSMLKPIVDTFKPSAIVHLAAYGNLIHQQEDDKIIQANITNLHNLLKATKDIEYEIFVNVSTSSVNLPVQTMYSATKSAGEKLCQAYATKYQKQIVSIRPYTVIGIGEPEEHLIPTLIRSCLEGEKMRFVGSPVHDFIGVNDFIDAIRLIIQNYNFSGVVEVGTGIQTSNEQVLSIVEKVTGKKANITRVDNMRSYDTKTWVADPTLIKSLGWEQKETITDIVEKMVYGDSELN